MQVKKILLIACLLILCGAHSFAGAGFCPSGKDRRTANKTTLASLAENDYDIKYLRFYLNMTDTSVYVAGNVSTTAQVVVSTMSNYVFELDTTLQIDSAFINGTRVSVTTTGGTIRTIALPTTLSSGAMFTARIYYKGMPPGGGGGFFNGITHSISSHGTHTVFTVSDPYVAKNWWPCKQSIPDKIDSVDMFVTVPRGVADGSNGLLVGVDTTTLSGYSTYHWKTNYKIDYYLISIAIAKYVQDKSYMHFSSSTDSMLIHNFYIDTASFNPAFKPGFDSIPLMIDYFSTLFGRYPFWREKYGVCYTTLPGGMEHQTMTTIGVPNTYIIAHEIGHQWFGDNVTYKTWGDVWLSEGFATFSEQLYYDHFWGASAALANRQTYLSRAIGNACGKLYVDDTSSATTLFDGTTVYAKGSIVARMLQYAAPSDAVFFNMLRTYQTTYAFGHASTDDLKTLAQTAYGCNLDTFFNQWVYGSGHPIYAASWYQSGSTVFVKLVQRRSCSATYNNHFSTYVQIKLQSAAGDTFVKVYNTLDTQVFTFNWTPVMTGIAVNPDIWTLMKLTLPITRDPRLGVGSIMSPDPRIYPNPSNDSWHIENVKEGVGLALFDVNGRAVWEGKTQGAKTTVPGQKLPPGEYFLHIDGVEGSTRLSRL